MKKRSESGLVDIHGEPLKAAPKPRAKATETTDRGHSPLAYVQRSTVTDVELGSTTATSKPPKKATLADRVAADITAILPDDLGPAPTELPKPPRDLTAYGDAYEAALKTCPHDTIEDTMHARGEVFCADCQRYMTFRTYQREREQRRPDTSAFFRLPW